MMQVCTGTGTGIEELQQNSKLAHHSFERAAGEKHAAEEKLEREAEEKAKRAGEHEMQVSLGGKSGDGVRAAASEDAGTSPASPQVLFSTVPIVTALCVVMLHVRM